MLIAFPKVCETSVDFPEICDILKYHINTGGNLYAA